MGAGTDVAVEAGDVVLIRSDPPAVASVIKLSRASSRKMIQNLADQHGRGAATTLNEN